jgi:hypothetical protein
MSTLPPNPTPEQLTQKRIDALEAEVAALQEQKAERAPWPLWVKLSTWAASKGGWMHALAGIYAAAAIFIETNAQAHALFIQVWADMPKQVVDGIALVAPLVAWYVGSLKKAPVA